jgi:type IV secretory pathway VirD2 relaxase
VKIVILRHTYTRDRDTARAALRYYQMRPRGEGEPPRSLFTREGTVSRDEAYRMLDEHQARGYLVHRLMFSPADDEQPDDLCNLTRHVLRELEKERGVTLHWVGVEHHNTNHPHVHVVLSGGTETRDGRREVRLDRADHARMMEGGRDYCRAEARERIEWERALADAATRISRGEHDADDPRAGRDDHDR